MAGTERAGGGGTAGEVQEEMKPAFAGPQKPLQGFGLSLGESHAYMFLRRQEAQLPQITLVAVLRIRGRKGRKDETGETGLENTMNS